MKQRVYDQMQRNCALHSICGSYESESFIGELFRDLLGNPNYKTSFNGRFLYVPGSNLIVGGDYKDFSHARIEKGFMDKRQMWFNRRHGPECGVIKFTFERNGDMWIGKYILEGKNFPVEARTELIDTGSFDEIVERHKDAIESFRLQLL